MARELRAWAVAQITIPIPCHARFRTPAGRRIAPPTAAASLKKERIRVLLQENPPPPDAGHILVRRKVCGTTRFGWIKSTPSQSRGHWSEPLLYAFRAQRHPHSLSFVFYKRCGELFGRFAQSAL